MSIFDDLSGLWQDVNTALAPAADFIDTVASDLIPGFNTVQALLGIGPPTGQTYSQAWPASSSGQNVALPSAVQVAQGVGGVYQGGATGDWSMDFPLTTTAGMGRGLIPFGGGMIPRGYHLKQLPYGRRGTPARAPGVYLTRNRRMNVLNPRALSRAERRMSGFTRYVKRHFQTSHLMPKRKSRSTRKRR